MIQLLGLREYTTKEGEVKKRDAFYENNWRAPSVADLFANLKRYIDQIPPPARVNMFYTAANCGKEKRQFKEQHIFAFDIDHIDVNRARDYVPIICQALGVKPDETGTVMTGHGLQIIVGLLDPITDPNYFKRTKPAYAAVIRKIVEALKAQGLTADGDTSVYDARRLLRLPGTVNDKSHKGLPPVDAQLWQANIKPVNFNIFQLAGMGDAPATVHDEVPADFMKRYPRIDTKTVLAGCDFLKHCHANPAKINEPQWYAALSITARLEGGTAISHALSKGHPGYSEFETTAKIEQALESSGPRTCKSIDALWDGCKTCPHWNKVTSPILLRGEDYLRTESTGFRNVTFGEGGKVSVGNPCFEDLVKFFERKHPFVTMAASRIVYVWTGTHYEVMARNELEAFAQAHIVPAPKMNHRKEFADLVQCSNIRRVDWFTDSTHRCMNFKNGYLSLDSMDFMPHTPARGFRHVLPYDYAPGADCPAFRTLMQNVTGGDEKLQTMLLEYAGYAVSNDAIWLQKALVLLGGGANGKSTWLNILKALAGRDNFSSLGLKDFESEYNRQMLDGKLFNVSEEMPRAKLETANFKAIATGATVQARKPYQEPYAFRNRAKLIFACNSLPDTWDTSDGFFRRFLIVPFNERFSDEKGNLDPFIEDKVLEELSGVFNLVLAAYRKLIVAKRFTDSEKSKEAAMDYRMEMDTVREWFADYVAVNTNGGMETTASRIGDMYDSYVRITRANGKAPVNSTWFGRKLSYLIPNYMTHHTEVWDKQMKCKTRILRGVTFVDVAPIGSRPPLKLVECLPTDSPEAVMQ